MVPSDETKFISDDKQLALQANDSVELSNKNKIDDSRNINHNTSIFSFSNKISLAMNTQISVEKDKPQN